MSTELQKFDQKAIALFVEKSLSAETRRKYRATVEEFSRFVGGVAPHEVTPAHVAAWRDRLRARNLRDSTIIFKLCVVRSLFDYLREGGMVSRNPAATKLVSAPRNSDVVKGRALSAKEVKHLLAGPDRSKPEGARDYAMMLVMLRLSLRVSEVCALRASSVRWEEGRWTLTCKVKGGREEKWPLPQDVKAAIDDCLRLDQKRRETVKSGGGDAFLFQPTVNYRSLEFDKGLSPRMVHYIVGKWGDYGRLGKVSPHDLRRTVVTHLLNKGHSYRDIQMVTKHRDPKTVQRYDKGRENLERNPVNSFSYDE
ncbi:MAG TPA: tyrosine-type recombinase/integrase [Pyrinomonadaceae bacterium]|jgi:site-specific recombinase XerD